MSKKQKKKPNKTFRQKQKKQSSNVPAILFFSICGIFIIAILIVFAMNSGEDSKTTTNSYDFTYVGQPAIGDKDAPIKMVEFGDYKCPACAQFEETIFKPLKEEFIDTGKVQFFFINYPFIGDDSYTAAEVGEAIYNQDEEAFWTYYTAVYEQQKEETQRWATMNFLRKLVQEQLPNINVDQLEREMKDRDYQSVVEEDKSIAGRAGVTGTPTIFINGEEFKDWFDYEAIRAELNRLLEQEENDA